MTNEEYTKVSQSEIVEKVKESFLKVESGKMDEIGNVLDGMETLDGAAALCITLMSVISSATTEKKHAAMVIGAFSAVMMG